MTVELVAIGLDPQHRSRFSLSPGKKFCLGRAPRAGYKVAWDTKISREHAELFWDGQILDVRCLETARNPLVVAGVHERQIQLAMGDDFQIGDTRFHLEKALADDDSAVNADILADRGFAPEDLSRVAYGHSDQRLEILANLPKAIAAAISDEDFAAQLAALLLRAIPQATATAV
ncbi:MAG TPA: FHA domain-containing protein, partial [Planctomycetaceae bacterium]